MITRNRATGLLVTLSLLWAGTALGQEAKAEVPRPKTKQAKPSNLERRIDDLEKVLATLADDLKALRKESEPAAPAPAADHSGERQVASGSTRVAFARLRQGRRHTGASTESGAAMMAAN